MPRQSGMSALEKEWKAIEKREQRLAKLALQGKDSAWKGKLEEKVPPKVSRALEAAFCKAFALVFEKGTGIIEKSYDSADLRQAYIRREEGVRQTMDRRSLRRVQGEARTGERPEPSPDHGGGDRPWGPGHWPAGHCAFCGNAPERNL